MTPFDITKALAGDPVVTSNGISVIIIKYAEGFNRPIIGTLGQQVHQWGEKGNYNITSAAHVWDLFMAPKTKQLFVNVYLDPKTGTYSSISYEDADTATKSAPNESLTLVHTALPFTFEAQQ